MNKSLRNEVLKQIKPNILEKKKLEREVKIFIKNLKKSAKSLDLNVEFFIGGSFGKNTYLKGNFDVDIFARFDKSYEDKYLSDLLKSIIDNLNLKYSKQKGSRDYYQVKQEKILFELVPNKLISNLKDAVNSTDYSPFHVEFLKNKIKKNKNLSDEIRLTKQFFKSHDLYGAESYINGFSGHVIDILIANFGSLKNLLNEAKNFKEQEIIDISNFYKNDKDVLAKMDVDKLSSLIVIDPILKERNAAKALSHNNYMKFLYIVNNFEQFSKDDFKIKKINLNKKVLNFKKFSKENNLDLFIYEFNLDLTDSTEDIVGSQMLRLHKKMISHFKSFDFKVFNDEIFFDFKNNKLLFLYFFEKKELSKIKLIEGPKIVLKDAVKGFIQKRKKVFVKNSRVCFYEKRNFTNIKQIIKLSKKDLESLLGRKITFIKSFQISK